MAVITPTATGLRWGPEPWQVYDYWAHPTRVAGGNPLFVFRHGGGGINGDLRGLWDNDGGNDLWYFLQYLRDAPGTGTRTTYWDVVSLESAQVGFENGLISPPIPRRRCYITEQVHDLKRGVCAIKALCSNLSQGVGGAFACNPGKIILGGNSHGAVLALLAGLTPPIYGRGAVSVFQARLDEHAYRDSIVRGVYAWQPQVDCRNAAGTDALWYGWLEGWAGCRTDDPAQWNALSPSLKAALSPIAYIEAGESAHYTPLYLMVPEIGTHVKPYGDPAQGGSSNIHDSQQVVDMAAALAAKGLPHQSVVYTPGTWRYHWPGTANPESAVLSGAMLAWMDLQIA